VSIQPGCNFGKVTINSVTAAPAIDCSAMTQLTVAGDGGNQYLYSQYLDSAAFSSHPKTVASLGDGGDLFFESRNVDNVDMGPGNDQAVLFYGGSANIGIDLGAGTTDQAVFYGSEQDDTITATSVGTGATIAQSNPDGGGSTMFANAKFLQVYGGGGNDTISSVGITSASTIDYVSLYAEGGNDTVTSGPIGAQLHGGTGTNTLTGSTGQDAFWSESDTDTLNGANDANGEFIYDSDSLRSGGRTLNGFTSIDTFVTQAHQGDVTMRVRPGSAGSAIVTTSLTRPGQQIVPASLGRLGPGQAYAGAIAHRGLADVVANAKPVNVTLPATGGGLIDVTVPTGAYEATLTGQNLLVTSSYGQINASYVPSAASYSVHGPWTDKNQGYVHRAYRDLLFRFPSNTVRDQIRDQLTAGTKSRAAVAQDIINTDEYRGLDVDRVFVKYLRRTSDPGGRTYWINALRGGRALWRFRAQLFGSNEYFTKAGGTNADYVTKAYNDVLGRNPDPSGQAYWTNKLNTGTERGQVALQCINSAEARRRLVDDQFLRFLDRLPTPSEQSEWSASLTSANGEQAMIAALVSSNGYYNRS
ncbi:MAG: DUF4214 domain-containing protein, partial [Aquihabitans sp.]